MRYFAGLLIVAVIPGLAPVYAPAADTSAPAMQEPVDPSGTWSRQYEWDGVPVEEVLRINLKRDGQVAGTLARNEETTPVRGGMVKGNELTFFTRDDYQGTPWETHFSGVVKGDEIQGTVVLKVDEESWEFPWSPVRSVDMDDVVGTWQIHIESEDGTVFEPSLRISRDGTDISSVYTSMQGQELDVMNLHVETNLLSFSVAMEYEGDSIKVDYRGRPYGDRMSGSLDYRWGAESGTAAFTARRH